MASSVPFYRRLWVPRRWRSYKAVYILFALEIIVNIPALALFAIAQPNLYRTQLWKDGFLNGFNSNPVEQIYAMVNRTPYTVPLIWQGFVTDYNVVISILCIFAMLVKGILFIMHIFPPLLGLFVHALFVGLWGWSVHAQLSPDNSDPSFPHLSAPWYIVKSCSVAHNKNLIGYCNQAKAALGVSIIMLFLFAANTALAIWSLFPTRVERLARHTRISEDDPEESFKFAAPPQSAKAKQWSQKISQLPPQSPVTMSGATFGAQQPLSANPVTPRTMAFQRLGGATDLPLRNNHS